MLKCCVNLYTYVLPVITHDSSHTHTFCLVITLVVVTNYTYQHQVYVTNIKQKFYGWKQEITLL